MIPNLSERERNVLQLLADDQSISVNEIATTLGVSSVSVRNYLNNLSEKGYLVRVRGGAISTFHPHIIERQQGNVGAKQRIAKAAAELVEDGDTVMIEAGTTTALIARYLLGKRDVTVVTNNTLALTYVRGNPGVRLTMIGGEFRAATESLVGPTAREQLERFRVRLAFVGTDGFSPENGLTTHLVEGAEVVRMMADHADSTIAVADSGKFGKTGFVHTLSMDQIDTLITDTDLSEDAFTRITELGVSVRCV